MGSVTQDNSPRKPFHIWEGIYRSFKDAAADAVGPGFSGDRYLTRSLNAANECLAALDASRPIPQFHKQRSNLLPVAAAMLLEESGRLRILDFGGGFGIGFMTLAESVPGDPARIDYTIVELPEVCTEGARLMGKRGVTYLDALPESGPFGLLHSASAIQYVEDWRALLGGFAALRPEVMLLSDVFAGHIPSFATLQNYYESRIPHWFLNIDELRRVIGRTGYRIILQSYAGSRRLDAEDTLPMDNFPQHLRLSQTLHLLLRRDS